MLDEQDELAEFVNSSIIGREMSGQLYVWVNADETKFSLSFNPHQLQQ